MMLSIGGILTVSNIKIIADSACDITREAAQRWGIEILPLALCHEGQQYRDWYDFTPQQFYDKLRQWDPLPTTSQVTPPAFLDAYQRAAAQGYDSILVVCLNAAASGTYQSATIAKEMLLDDPAYAHIQVEVIDSTTYAYLIGLHLEHAAQMAQEGQALSDIVHYLCDRYSRIQAYAAVYTLDFLKRTGRINGAAGFVANLLDIKPILRIGNREIRPVDKVRGKKKTAARLVQLVQQDIDPDSHELIIVHGDMPQELEQLRQLVAEAFPGFTVIESQMGSAIALHAGPHLLGLAFHKKLS